MTFVPRRVAFSLTVAIQCMYLSRTVGAAVKLVVSPTHVVSKTWVNVSFTDVPTSELRRPSTEYICKQDSDCADVHRISLWIGVFGKGLSRKPIGPQNWATANPPWLETSPIKWKPINDTSGSVSFHMEMGRNQQLVFVLFSNGTTWPIELAVSEPLTFIDADAPQHVRLARTFNAAEMRVSWSVLDLVCDAYVRWGTASNHYEWNASAKATSYGVENLCGPPATTHGWMREHLFYSAVIGPLPEAPARVYYTVGSNTKGWSREHSFPVPQRASADATLRVLAIADVGETYIDGAQYHWMEPFAINTTSFALNHWGSKGHLPLVLNPAGPNKTISGKEGAPKGRVLRAASGLAAQGPTTDLVLHVGDLAYATGYSSEWDQFMSQIEPLSSQAPYMVAQGNHERDWPGSGSDIGGSDSGGECGIPTSSRFPMPKPAASPAHGGWYSFDQGPVHFVAMGTEFSAHFGSSQMAFLQADLAAVDRATTPWIVVMGHRPMYNSQSNSKGFDLSNGPWWPDVEKVFLQYEVDLCLWGHVHNAEVTCPLMNGTCIESRDGQYAAPVHATIGNGGQSLSSWCTDGSRTCCCSSIGPTCQAACNNVPAWSKWRLDAFGFAQLEVHGARELTMNFYVDCDGERDGPTLRDCKRFDHLVHSFTLSRQYIVV
eukprot:TRINITY_DN23667_c0_g1_i1.p1 TRINITY_DN23667_c0_g1~~TRINITY_DN23667_c0_g1_i1.p1  ORF type:complete len:687 (-),score=77.31 TRINITY_DN23667_c0_g1_i1:259-2238(-)